MRPLTRAEAMALPLPAEVWREESGGLDGSRYRAEKLTADRADEVAMYFIAGSGRAWSAYGRTYCGWRIWTSEPTDTERLAERWEDNKNERGEI